MSKHNQTFRFAFGTPEDPASGVWRATRNGKSGDIYLQNLPQLANSVHIALHASGNFSLKIGNTRNKLEPPYEFIAGCYYGLFIVFKKFVRPAPPTPATGNVSLVNWLGFPAQDSIFVIKLVYAPQSSRLSLNSDETLIGELATCRLFHKPMMLNFVLQHRELIGAERTKWHVENLDFGGKDPETVEGFRISKSSLGPSAVIHQEFSFSPGPSEI